MVHLVKNQGRGYALCLHIRVEFWCAWIMEQYTDTQLHTHQPLAGTPLYTVVCYILQTTDYSNSTGVPIRCRPIYSNSQQRAEGHFAKADTGSLAKHRSFFYYKYRRHITNRNLQQSTKQETSIQGEVEHTAKGRAGLKAQGPRDRLRGSSCPTPS